MQVKRLGLLSTEQDVDQWIHLSLTEIPAK